MEIQVIYEDDETVVINKPVGLVVNRAESISGSTVQDWSEKQNWFPKTDDKLYLSRSGICHRLDKETSGCLILAKSPEALRYYLKLFKDRELTKEYRALVHGRVSPRKGDVILPMKRSVRDREKWQVHYEGKKAVTEWEVLKHYEFSNTEHFGNTLSLLKIGLKTGRTHQIRVHLSFLGWPIFADEKYLNVKILAEDRKFLPHHFLHAAHLELVSFRGKKMSLEAPLPDDAESFLKTLQEC